MGVESLRKQWQTTVIKLPSKEKLVSRQNNLRKQRMHNNLRRTEIGPVTPVNVYTCRSDDYTYSARLTCISSIMNCTLAHRQRFTVSTSSHLQPYKCNKAFHMCTGLGR